MADHLSSYSRTPNTHSSFSSTLVEQIWRSIDRGGGGEEHTESMRKKRDDATTRFLFKTDEDIANYQRACMIERWMEKKIKSRTSTPDPHLQNKLSGKDRQNSSSSSSASSCGGDGAGRAGGFYSSSEPEFFPLPTGKLGFHKEKLNNCDYSGFSRRNRRGFSDGSEQKEAESESKFVKKKSKALKMYGDLKRAKQPISPGGKVAAFLNSLFASGNVKKSKIAASYGDESASVAATTCSSASSFSRFCLSKGIPPPPSSAKSLRRNDDVDAILSAIDEELAMHVRKKDRMRCEMEILSKIGHESGVCGEEIEEEDDGASCTSSDLFELENLSSIGIEELPVYETTHHLHSILQMD